MLQGFKKRDRLVELFLKTASGDAWIVKRALEEVSQKTPAGQELNTEKVLQRIEELRRQAASEGKPYVSPHLRSDDEARTAIRKREGGGE